MADRPIENPLYTSRGRKPLLNLTVLVKHRHLDVPRTVDMMDSANILGSDNQIEIEWLFAIFDEQQAFFSRKASLDSDGRDNFAPGAAFFNSDGCHIHQTFAF